MKESTVFHRTVTYSRHSGNADYGEDNTALLLFCAVELGPSTVPSLMSSDASTGLPPES